ncbi:unnamed protein product [Leptosia nina]|uniref:Uncharacterized protein n=1 Tax=Leptosia nina TaxID=320188 RepID=A0AAV1J488_9NEOP
MKLIIIALLFCFLNFCASAPKQSLLEQAYLDKLNKPWFTPDSPPEYPRKGEGLCKGKSCKVNCDDCQVSVPLDVNWEYVRK